ncbi:MAG: hypothetical protein K9I34_02705 [Bacteroidales bacterium]|nr:hypothetical protein [Bacteroidales bacterium]
MFNKYLILLSFAFVIQSCIYNTDEVYYQDLDSNFNVPQVDIVQLDLSLDKDTIELMYSTVYFNFTSSNNSINYISFYVDDYFRGRVESGNGIFQMNYDFIYEGYHKLRIDVAIGSNTGSIADSLGLEGSLFQKEWVIKVNNTPHSNATTTTVKDGFLVLRWQKKNDESHEYSIFKNGYEIGKTTETEFIDSGYVGRGANYDIYLEEHKHYSYVDVPGEVKLKLTYDNDNNFYINWDNLKYYSAIDSIIIITTGNSGGDHTLNTTDIYLDGFPIPGNYFGEERYFKLLLTPKYSNPYYESLTYPHINFLADYQKYKVGYPSPAFAYAHKINDDEIFGFDDYLYRYSIAEGRMEETYKYDPAGTPIGTNYYFQPRISPDGKSYVSCFGSNRNLIYGSTSNLQDFKVLDMSSFVTNPTKFFISNNGICTFIEYAVLYFYNVESENIMTTFEITNGYLYDISGDADYFYIATQDRVNLYSYSNGNIVNIRNYHFNDPPVYNYFCFSSSDSNEAVAWNADNKTFDKIRLSDLQIINSFLVDEDKILDIDFENEQILSYKDFSLIVRDLAGGTILYEFPSSVNSNCILSGNHLLSGMGVCLKLN